MAKQRDTSNEIVPVPREPQQTVIDDRETAIVAAIDALVERRPEAISWDVADCENEAKTLRAQTDPGVPAQIKDGWRGRIIDWWIGVWESADTATRASRVDPCLALFADNEQLVRLTGWPAIDSWAKLIKAAGIQRLREGLPVVIRRRPSSTAGHSYWVVLPDWSKLEKDNGGSK